TMNVHYRDKELQDTSIQGQTPNMSEIDTRALVAGRFFSEAEDRHAAPVCVIGDKLVEEFFAGVNPIGKSIRAAQAEFTIIGVYEKRGAGLGSDSANFALRPLSAFLR